jgi:hypothetical protein
VREYVRPRRGASRGFDFGEQILQLSIGLADNAHLAKVANITFGEPFHVQQASQIRAFRAAWKEAGHCHDPHVSVSRSIFAIFDDRDRTYFGPGGQEEDQVGSIDENTRAIFGRGLCRRA